MKYKADDVVKRLDLKPLPREGGWFKVMYRSEYEASNLPERFTEKHKCTSYIYYLLKRGEVSKLHMLNNDEIWFWLAGGTLKMQVGSSSEMLDKEHILIGSDIFKENISYLVQSGKWQTTEVFKGDYCLVACVVSPSFEESDFFIKEDCDV